MSNGRSISTPPAIGWTSRLSLEWLVGSSIGCTASFLVCVAISLILIHHMQYRGLSRAWAGAVYVEALFLVIVQSVLVLKWCEARVAWLRGARSKVFFLVAFLLSGVVSPPLWVAWAAYGVFLGAGDHVRGSGVVEWEWRPEFWGLIEDPETGYRFVHSTSPETPECFMRRGNPVYSMTIDFLARHLRDSRPSAACVPSRKEAYVLCRGAAKIPTLPEPTRMKLVRLISNLVAESEPEGSRASTESQLTQGLALHFSDRAVFLMAALPAAISPSDSDDAIVFDAVVLDLTAMRSVGRYQVAKSEVQEWAAQDPSWVGG